MSVFLDEHGEIRKCWQTCSVLCNTAYPSTCPCKGWTPSQGAQLAKKDYDLDQALQAFVAVLEKTTSPETVAAFKELWRLSHERY